MRRVVLDAIDPFVDRPGAYEAARTAIEEGNLEILYVHTTLTEAAATLDLDRRSRLLLVLAGLGRLVPSSGMIFDGDLRFDQSGFTDEAGSATLTALASGSLGHENNRRDALAAATALANDCALVTNDHRLTKRARESGIEVLSTATLLAELGLTD